MRIFWDGLGCEMMSAPIRGVIGSLSREQQVLAIDLKKHGLRQMLKDMIVVNLSEEEAPMELNEKKDLALQPKNILM